MNLRLFSLTTLTLLKKLLTTLYSLLSTHYSLLTTHYSLLSTHYSLLTNNLFFRFPFFLLSLRAFRLSSKALLGLN